MPRISFNKKSGFLKLVFTYLKRNNIFLILILFLAIFLRFYQLDKQIWWMGGDDARDMLVIRHIVEYGETINRGPLALGGLNWLQNSPVYYYFGAFLWLLATSAKGVMYLWASLFTLPVLLAYLLVKKLSNKNSALLAALFFAINPYMINVSKNLSQAHLPVVFSSFFIYFLISYLSNKKKQLPNLLGMIAAVFLTFHFHYSIILVFPSLFILLLLFYWRLNAQENKVFGLKMILPVLLTLFLFISWLNLTYTTKIFDQFLFLKFNSFFRERNFFSIISSFWNSCILLLRLLWGNRFAEFMLLPSLACLLFLIFRKRHLSSLILKNSLTYFLFILSSLFLIVLYRGALEETYFLFLLPIVLVLLSLTLILLLKKIKYYAWPIIILAVCLMLWSTIEYNFGNFSSLPVYEKKRLLAELISDDYSNLYPSFNKNVEQPKFLLIWDSQVFYLMCDSWGNSGVWFHLEDVFQQQLVKLTNYGPNYQSLINNPQVIYGICHYDNDHTKINNCLDNFLKRYPVHQSDTHFLWVDEEVVLLRVVIRMSLKLPLVNTINY